jgi:hypothetical protein
MAVNKTRRQFNCPYEDENELTERVVVRLGHALLGAEFAHHLHRRGVPVARRDLPVGVAAVAATGGCDPDQEPALLEQSLHRLHRV